MKYIFTTMLIFLISFVTGCAESGNSGFYDSVSDKYDQHQPDESQPDNIDESQNDEIEESILENTKPYIMIERNTLFIRDLKTWSLVFTHTFEEFDLFNSAVILENDYFVISGRNYSSFELAWQEWWANNHDWPEEDDYGNFIDFTLPEDEDSEFIFSYSIFDEKFNFVDSFLFGNNFNVLFFKYENNELIVYGNNIELNDTGGTEWIFYRKNLATGVMDELFRLHDEISMLALIGNCHFLGVSDNISFGEQIGQEFSPLFRDVNFGLINIETGAKNFFTVENFGRGHTDVVDSQMLISEMGAFNLEQTNRVILFDIEAETYEVIQLLPNDSHVARLSLDGNHIVTTNLAENLFRKYDLEGNVLFETAIEIRFNVIEEEFSYHDVFLFAIDENTYSIHYTPFGGQGRRQVEFININE